MGNPCGKEKGITIYSFISAIHNLFYSTAFSASDREAWYVIDGLMHNDVVRSQIHSTDSHGATDPVFSVSYLLGVDRSGGPVSATPYQPAPAETSRHGGRAHEPLDGLSNGGWGGNGRSRRGQTVGSNSAPGGKYQTQAYAGLAGDEAAQPHRRPCRMPCRIRCIRR